MSSQTITACRSCGKSGLEPILDLGATPLANRLLTADELSAPEPRYPLALVFCPACSLAQITETVAPEILFRDYLYFSSFSTEFLEHSKAHVADLIRRRRLDGSSLVIEAASNDGYLLQFFMEAGIPVLGIEPALNIARFANQRGVRTLPEFFGLECARRLRREGHRADVVLGNNVLAHVADLNGFVAGAVTLLADGGVVELEFPYVVEMIDNVEFDTIYHEHLCYFSAHAIEALFARHGLQVTDVARLPIHGGSLRVTGARSIEPEGRARVQALLDEEKRRGVDRFEFYAGFRGRVAALREALLALLRRLRAEGKRVVAYGASAKGSTLLNCFGIDVSLVEFVVDRSTVKQGRFTPGTHLLIHPPSRLLEDHPDYALLLTWNFAGEIMRQQEEYRRRGGRFIIPVPEVRIA